MKIVNIIGGLGNQMFQYAFALALKEKYPYENITINTRCFRGYRLHNGYELKHLFQTSIPEVKLQDLFKYGYPWVNYNIRKFRSYLPKRKCCVNDEYFEPNNRLDDAVNKTFFDGYWQCPSYIEKYKEIIKQTFVFPQIEDKKNHQILSYIRKAKTAFIHVRRGDYNNHPVLGGICTNKYYETALKTLIQNYGYEQFIVFSNDMNWCRKNISQWTTSCEVRYVDWNNGKDSYKDMELMTFCKAGIIANSSFSWWGAWLADAEVILCPEKWANGDGDHSKIIPSYWKKIPIY